MTDDERVDYERACRDRTKELCRRMERHPSEGQETRSVTLARSYPDTEIVVEVWDHHDNRMRTQRSRIWHSANWSDGEGRHADPEHVGMLIATWAHGG
jgi:hypothetical protein